MKYIIFIILLFNLQFAIGKTKILVSTSNTSANNEYSYIVSDLNKAINLVKQTDTTEIILDNGDYYLSNTINLHSNLSIVAKNRHKAIISGALKIKSDWKRVNDSIYSISIDNFTPWQIFINNKVRSISRYAENDFKSFKQKYIESKPSESLFLTYIQVPKKIIRKIKNDNNGDLYFSNKYHYYEGIRSITGIANDSILEIKGEAYSENDQSLGNRCNIYNVYNLLKKGTFCYKRQINQNILYYCKYDNEDISSIEIPVTEMLYDGDGSNISLEGLVFEKTAFKIGEKGYIPLQGGSPNDKAALYFEKSSNIFVKDCVFSNLGSWAVKLESGCKNFVIRDNYIHDTGGGGIFVGTWAMKSIADSEISSNILIENNLIHTTGLIAGNCSGVGIFQANYVSVKNNTLLDISYDGVLVGINYSWSYDKIHNNYIGYNYIAYNGNCAMDDLAGVFVIGKQDGTVIENNVIHDIIGYPSWPSGGIYLDQSTTNVTVKNNLVYNCYTAGLYANPCINNLIKNNIFAYNTLSAINLTKKLGKWETDSLMWTNTNNIYITDGSCPIFSRKDIDNVRVVQDKNIYWNSDGFAKLKSGSHDWRVSFDKNSFTMNPDIYISEKPVINSNSVLNKIGYKTCDYSKVGANIDIDITTLEKDIKIKYGKYILHKDAKGKYDYYTNLSGFTREYYLK